MPSLGGADAKVPPARDKKSDCFYSVVFCHAGGSLASSPPSEGVDALVLRALETTRPRPQRLCFCTSR